MHVCLTRLRRPPSPVAFLHIRPQRPEIHARRMLDLSPGGLVCAAVILGLSGAHMYCWHHPRDILYSFVAFILSIVPFIVWQRGKNQPQFGYQHAHSLALVLPEVYGLCVNVYICWRTLDTEGISWRYTPVFLVIIALVAVTLQIVGLLGLSGILAAEKAMPPPFFGSLLIHGSATFYAVYLLWKFPSVRRWKFVSFTSCFTFAFCGDLAFVGLTSRVKEFGPSTLHEPLYLIPCISEALVQSLLLLVRLIPPAWFRKTFEHKENYKQMSKSTIEEPRTSPSTQPSNIAVGHQLACILRSESLSEEDATIRGIHEIRKTDAGVDILALIQRGNLLRLLYLDWKETKYWPEVKEIVGEDVYKLAEKLSVISGASGRVIYSGGLDEVFLSRTDCEELLRGGNLRLSSYFA